MAGVKKAKTSHGESNKNRRNGKAYAKNHNKNTITVAGAHKNMPTQPVWIDYHFAKAAAFSIGQTLTVSH